MFGVQEITRTMKIIGFILLAIILLIVALYAFVKYRLKHITDKHQLAKTVDDTVQKFIDKGKATALVIALVKEGETYWNGYGMLSDDTIDTPNAHSLFELASTSKIFTTSTLQILVNKGYINLDDTIQSILGDKVQLPAHAQNVTLRHLATHTSGFPSLPKSFLQKMTDDKNPYKDLIIEDMYDYLVTCEDKKTEGNFQYSNFGMGLLGHLMTLKTGQPFETLVKENLLQPLQMNQTVITLDHIQEQLLVQGFDHKGYEAPIWQDNVLTGAGSFISNAADMVQFMKANLNIDNHALSPALTETQQPQFNGKTGLGWILPDWIDRMMEQEHLVWHNGMAGGYASYLAIDRFNGIGVMILSNKAIDVSLLGIRLARHARTQSWKRG